MTDPEPPPWVDPAEAGSLRRRIPFRSRGLERCTMCALPPSLCICADLPTIDVATRVLLVIHHVEMKKSTNTGRLAVRILSGGAANVRGAIHGPPRTQVDGPRLVLFPDPAARPVTPADRGKVLVVPDGNWGQARRMINRDPDLLGGELVTVQPAGPSRYGLRRNRRPDALCTF